MATMGINISKKNSFAEFTKRREASENLDCGGLLLFPPRHQHSLRWLHGWLCCQSGESANVLWNRFIHLLGGTFGPLIIFRLMAGAWAALVLASCSPGSNWSAEERKNANHFFQSLNASAAATKLTNREPPPGQIVMLGAEKILAHHKTALREARLVSDGVLDKAHPALRQHFRTEYEKGLELVIQGMELGMSSGPSQESVRLSYEGALLLNRWVDWLNAHNKEIRIPKAR